MPRARKPALGYRWHLRRLMADAGLYATTELTPLLAERGIVLSQAQVYRLVTGTPSGSACAPSSRCATSSAAPRTS